MSGNPVEKWSKSLLLRPDAAVARNKLNTSISVAIICLAFDLDIAEALAGMATCTVGPELAPVDIVRFVAGVALF